MRWGALYALLVLLVHFSLSQAELTASYDQGPTQLGPNALISWSVDNVEKMITIGMQYNDSALRTTGTAWVGIGVGEDTSGSMLGADIFSAVFKDNTTDECEVKNRHVPFASYPISRGTYPQEDLCQSEESWALVSCNRNPARDTVTLEVKRPLGAFSIQDRAIVHGENSMMYAFGAGGFAYHERRRFTRRFTFFNSDGTYPSEQVVPIPDDVVKQVDVVASNYTVPNGTTYACTTFKLNIPQNETYYVVAADVILDQLNGSNKAHHFLVWTCKDTNVSRKLLRTQNCGGGSFGEGMECSSMVYGWAVGAGRYILPDDVGFKVDSTYDMILVDAHYDNPGNETNVVDLSGTRLYMSKNRSIQAGLLALGDPIGSLFGQTVKNDFNYTSTCPSNCTATWQDEEVTVVSSLLHMHTTGHQIWTNRYSADGNFVETMNAINFWSNDHQSGTRFNPPKKIRRTDILSTTCIFDTTLKPKTVWGTETKDEMCMDFLVYYPVQRRGADDGEFFKCGMQHYSRVNFTGTGCGNPIYDRNYDFTPNPSFNDSVGVRVDFGRTPAGCTKALAGKLKDTNASATNKTTPECFPGDALVRTADGVKLMRHLEVGDEVEVGKGRRSRIYMFTHRNPHALPELVVLRTASGELSLTVGHMLYVGGELTRADAVRLGDALSDGNGQPLIVTGVSRRRGRGLYNPQTKHGDLVVNEVLTSTYTASIQHDAAHALLAPLRAFARWLTISVGLLETEGSALRGAFVLMQSAL